MVKVQGKAGVSASANLDPYAHVDHTTKQRLARCMFATAAVYLNDRYDVKELSNPHHGDPGEIIHLGGK